MRAIGYRFIFAVTLSCIAAWNVPATAEKVPKASPLVSQPNIVLILADDLGYGDLGSYGQTVIATPELDQMAEEGMRFSQMYAGSTVCGPSRCVLMTGLHTGHCRIRGNEGEPNLNAEDRTIAEYLKSAGYVTGIIGKWGIGPEGTEGVPNKKGFDYFFGYLHHDHAHNHYPTFLYRNDERVSLPNVVPSEGEVGDGVATERLVYAHDLFTQEALDFVNRNHNRRFFLYLPYTLPHANNEAGDEGMEVPDYGPYAGRDWPQPEKGFAAMIHRLDRDVGRLLAELKYLGLDKDTIVIFSSDNGPHAEGGHDPAFFMSDGGLRGRKRDLYEGGIRVPFIVWWPGQIQAGATSDFVGYFADIFPTIADLAGLPLLDYLDGVSILPVLQSRPLGGLSDRYLYWEFYENAGSQAVRFGNWKAVRRPFRRGEIELYNLSDDPGETTNVAAFHPDLVKIAIGFLEEAHTPTPLWKPRYGGGFRGKIRTWFCRRMYMDVICAP